MIKQNGLYILIWSLLLSSCERLHKDGSYSGFNFQHLRPESMSIDGLKVDAKYTGRKLESLKYIKNGYLFREDTVVYSERVGFFLPKGVWDSNENTSEIIRVSASILDTSRTFVFKKKESGYHLALMESSLNDSSIKIQFFWKSDIKPNIFRLSTLDSLAHYYSYAIAFKENIVLKYYYNKGWLYYNMMEDYGSWQARKEGYDSLKFHYGSIYLDIDLVEEKESLLHEMQRLGWPEPE